MIPKMFLHTLAATLIVAGLAGAWQVCATADGDWTLAPAHHENAGGGHDD